MIKDLFDQFFTKYNGKPVEVEDPTNIYQCFDLAFAWVDFLNIPRTSIRHLYAYEIFTKPNVDTPKYFQTIKNTPTGVPQVGDLVIFDTTVGIAGHVCISNGTGDTKTFISFDQNWAGVKKAVTVTHKNYNGVLGWLRPILPTEPNCEEKYNTLLDEHILLKNKYDKTVNDLEAFQNKYAEDLKNMTEQRDNAQKASAEMTAQMTVMGNQVKTALSERDSAKAEVADLETVNNALKLSAVDLNDKITSLEDQLANGLKAYPKSQLFWASLGFYGVGTK